MRRGSKVIVIHPGSRLLRIGRAADVVPTVVPHVIARKCRTQPAPPPLSLQSIMRPQLDKDGENDTTDTSDEYQVKARSDDPVCIVLLTIKTRLITCYWKVEKKIAAITTSLRDRMRFYQIRVVPNASKATKSFNEMVVGEPTSDPNFRQNKKTLGDILIGEDVSLTCLGSQSDLDMDRYRFLIYQIVRIQKGMQFDGPCMPVDSILGTIHHTKIFSVILRKYGGQLFKIS